MFLTATNGTIVVRTGGSAYEVTIDSGWDGYALGAQRGNRRNHLRAQSVKCIACYAPLFLMCMRLYTLLFRSTA